MWLEEIWTKKYPGECKRMKGRLQVRWTDEKCGR